MAAMMNNNNYLLKYANFFADPLFSLGAAHPWIAPIGLVGTLESKFAVADGGMLGNMVTLVPGDFLGFGGYLLSDLLRSKNVEGKNLYVSYWLKGVDVEPKVGFQIDVFEPFTQSVYGADESTPAMAGWTLIEGLLHIPAELGDINMNIYSTTVNPVSVCNVTIRLGKSVDTAAQFTLYNP
jgi:hypothetical protein